MMKKTASLILTLLLLLQLAALPVSAEGETTDPDAAVTTTTHPTTTTGEDVPVTTTTHKTTTRTAGSGIVATKIIIMDLDGKIVARVTNEKGEGIAGIPVKLQLGTTVMPAVQTDGSGYARFRYIYPDSKTYISCEALQTVIDGVTYIGSSAAVGTQSPAASTAHAPGVATEADEAVNGTATSKSAATTGRSTTGRITTAGKTTSAAPTVTYPAAATTGMEETFVSLGVNFDSNVLEAFGCDGKDFAEISRLLMSQERYAALAEGTSGVLQLRVAISEMTVPDEHIAAALQNDTVLSRINPADVPRAVLDLNMQIRNEKGAVSDFWNVTNDSYVIQFPVPKSMRSAQSITVSAVTEQGISGPVIVNVTKDGYLRFETSLPVGTVVLLGFESGMLGRLTSHAVRSSILFFVLGILCIGGAVAVFIFFVHTPKNGKKKSESLPAEEEPLTEEEEELPPVGADNARISPTDQLDIFSDDPASESHSFKPKNPADYDIDL